MKWFRHYSDCINSESLDALIERFGYSGYGRWWRILEIIASKMDKTDRCHVEFSVSKWCEILRMRPPQLREFCAEVEQIMNRNCVESTQISLKVDAKFARFEVPNLKNFRDEYTARVGSESGETTSSETDTESESDTESEEKRVTTGKPVVSERRPVHTPNDLDPIREKWNALAEELPPLAKIIAISGKRREAVKARLGERDFNFDKLLEAVRGSPFLRGQNNRNWVASFDWCIKATNWPKIIEGQYAGKQRGLEKGAERVGGVSAKEFAERRAATVNSETDF